MIKTVLVHVTGTDCDPAVLETAVSIARLYSAHLDVLRVVPDPAALAAQAAQLAMGASMVLADTVATIEKDARERTERARTGFDAFVKREKIALADAPSGTDAITATWSERKGDDVERIAGAARFHDLVVLAGGRERPGRLWLEGFGAILISSGRPILLAPERPRDRFSTVAVAWKNSVESAHAVAAAMPILTKASRVEVLSANEADSAAMECVECAAGVVRHLRWHGINAHSQFVLPAGRTVADAILQSAKAANADLLVMGGYGHSRFREFIFGGVTQAVLGGVDIPVLLSH